MFHDRVSSNTGTSRKGPQSLPVTGPRKRSRPSSSSSSDTRLVPRDPSTRAWSKLSEQRGKVSTPPRNVASAKAGGLATSGGVGSNQSAHRNAEEYLDDVRFDVTPRDMCIVGSQDFARSEDDRVVMEELCSLGSVLAGGRGDESMMEEESADPNADDGNSKGSRDDSSHGGCNLLTRWLQPASGSCPIDANSNSNQGTVGDAEESLADLDGLAAVGGDGVGGEAQGGTVGSTVNGSKIVSDWARRALLRKKMADAERGRKLRTQLRGDTAASGSRLGSEVPNAFPQDGELAPSSNRNSTSGLPTTPASPGKQSENRRDSHDTDHAGKSARGGSATAAPTGACVERGGSVIGFSRTGEESGKGAGVEESDGYGDDFDFLSEAELKAMEDEAAKVSASQRASQIPVKELSVNCHPRTWPSSRDGRVVENRSDKPGERSLMDETSRDVGSNAREQDSNGCKRPAGPTGRSHLASSGEKTKLGDNGKHNGRFASSQSNCGAVMGNGDGQAMASETLPRFKHGSDQATNQEVAVHASSDVMNAVKREYREGLVEEPSADREGSAGDAVGLEPRSKSLGNGDAHAEEFNPRKASWSSSWSQAKNAMGPNGTAKPPLFARNGGMSQYAASMPFASGVAKRASDVSSDPKSGPGVGIDGADRRPQERMLTKDPGDDLGGARNSPARELGSGTRPSDFSPAFVHRRFLVLEVSYGRCGHGAGPGGGSPREKILMALEQLCEVMPGSTANGSEGAATEAVGERSTVSQKRQIALRGDWYDCEVEPGELVHVIVPVGRQSSRRASVPIADVGTKEALDSEHVVLDNVSGKLLIVQPDILVSPTKVADTVLCARKAVLQSRIASDASKSKAAVLGSLKHELFETSLLAAAASARVSAETVSNPTATAASAWQAVGRDRVMGGASKGGGRQSERQLLSSQYMAALVDRIILSQLEALYGAGLDECTARRELLAVSLPILTWHRSFLVDRRPCVGLTAGRASVPSDGGAGSVESSYAVNQPGGRTSRRRSGGFPADPRGLASLGPDGIPAAKVQVARVLSTEDDVWSPVLGLKGILDVTVEAEVEMLTRGINNVAASDSRRAWDRNRGRGSGPGGTAPGSGLPPGVVADRAGGSQRALVMPVEVKTGKRIGDAHSAHRAQVMLYTLLMRVRYGNEACPSGLLVYTSGEGLHTELISPVPAEIRALVLARNRYASGMAKVGRVGLVRSGLEGVADGGQPGGSALPPVIRRPRECGMCFQLSECMLYHRAAEGGDEESSGLDQGVFDKKVGHLSEAHLTFFSHWDRAIDLEGKIGEQVRSSMWQESGPERESRTGKCMSTLIWLGERDCDASAPRTTPDGHVVSVEGSPLGDAGAKRFVHVFARRWAAPELLSRESRGRQKHGDRASPAVRDGIEARSAMREESTTMVEHPLLRPKWARPLTDLSLAVGDMVCISSEGGVGNVWGSLPEKSGVQEIASRPHGGHEVDHCRLLTGNIAAIFKDTVEVFSEKRMRVPRRGGRRSRGLGGGGNGSEAGQPLDIEDLLGEARPGAPVGGAGGVLDSGSGKAGEGTVFFRIDKDEWAAGINMMRSNLVRLMTGPSPECEESGDVKDGGDNLGDERRRKLVVDLDPPRFERFTGLLDVPGTLVGWLEAQDAEAAGARGGASAGRGREAEELQDIFRDELNEDQRAAVRKVITAKDYALLLGMPGTGKTWTIAFAVRVLLARGASVLITSYTHSAVDNLLLKLIGEGVPCLRIGKPASVHPGVRPHCINQDASVTTTAAYAELVASARVVGCTCLGVKHPLFAQRRFDYCVVDEAGQISQPVVLAPLRCADVFVLVGDHYQLPPLVTSKEALEVGMSESLFQRLCEAHPGSLQRLSYQYRMNGDVMALCNDLTYSGRLRCGNSSVEGQRLYLPRLSAIPAPHRPEGLRSAAPLAWLSQVLDPHRRVLFLDTDAIAPESRRNPEDGAGPAACDVPALTRRGCGEMRSFLGLEFRSTARGSEDDGGGGGARSGKGSVVNEVESDIVRLLIWGLDIAGFDLGEAGVISPYRSQVRLLQAVLKRPFPGLEINTIDKYQGRDKEVILVSFVRSNPEGTVGNLLRDWRRLNVALSRAKRKLLLLGSLRTLSSCAILSSLTDILQSRGWVYSLPPEAPGLYPSGLGFPSDNTNGEGNGNGRALKTFDEGFSPLGGQGRAGVHRGVEEPNGVPAGTTAEDCKYLVDSHGHSRTKALCVLDGGRTATHLSAGRGGRRDRGSSGDVSGKGVRSATGSAAISGGIPRASSLRRSAD